MLKRKTCRVLLCAVMAVALTVSNMPLGSVAAAGSGKVGKVTIKSAKRAGKRVKVKWKSVSGASKYQMVLAKKKSGKQVVYKKTTKSTNVTTTALATGTYYVKVRAIGKNKGAWSKAKKVTVKAVGYTVSKKAGTYQGQADVTNAPVVTETESTGDATTQQVTEITAPETTTTETTTEPEVTTTEVTGAETTTAEATIPTVEIPSASEASTTEENTANWNEDETNAADNEEAWNQSDVVYVDFTDDTVKITNAAGTELTGTGVTLKSGVLKITVPATYVLNGTMTDGSIQVKSGEGEYNIILNGVDVTSSTTAAFYATKKATKVTLTLAQGTTNKLTGPESYVFEEGEDEPDATLFVKKALTINGGGSLEVTDPNGDAIKCKDILKIADGNITVNAGDDGITGKDALAIAGGTINVTANGDGIKTNLQKDADLGYVDISGGNITIISGGDGIQADTTATLANATIDITTKYNSANDSFKGIKAGGTITITNDDGTTTDTLMGLVHIKSGTLTLNTVEDAIKSKKDMLIDGGHITVNSYSDGIQADYNLTISGDDTYVNVTTDKNSAYTFIDSYKGIKAGASSDSSDNISEENGTLLIKGGTIIVDTTKVGTTTEYGNNKGDDALHSNNILQIDGGNLTLTAGDDGIHSDLKLVINGGTIDIPSSYEGIESYYIYLEGGTATVVSSDDGINAAGGNDSSGNAGGNNPWGGGGWGGWGGNNSSSTGYLYINGGTYTFRVEGDGLDSNGSIYMTGGTVYVYGPTSGGNGIFDYGDNNDDQFVKSGGLLIGAGTSDMAVYPTCTTGAFCKFSVSGNAYTNCSITTNGTTYNFTPTKKYSLVVISTPEMTSGNSYTLTYGNGKTSTATAVTSSSSSGGGPGGGPGGGGRW